MRSKGKNVVLWIFSFFLLTLSLQVDARGFYEMLAWTAPGGGEVHGGHDKSHTAMLRTKSDVILGMLIVILLLTVMFEWFHEFLLEKLEHQHQHLLVETVDTLFRELMVLGFISLLLFTFTRTGATQALNDRIFGENIVEKIAKKELRKEGEPQVLAPTVLFELFEDVHIFIFVVMSLFLVVVAFQIFMAMRQRTAWKRYESRSLQARQMDIETRTSNSQELEFWVFYWRFLHPSTPFPAVPADPGSFPFHEYLSEKLGQCIIKIVEIPLTTWVVVFLIALLVRPVLDFPPVGFAAFAVFCSAGILATSLLLFFVLKSIKRKLRPSLEDVRSYLLFLGGADESSIPGVAAIENYDFVIPNNFFQRFVQDVKYINRQEALFWFGAKGPAYFLRLLQLLLFLNVVLCTVLIRMLFTPHWQKTLFAPLTYWIGIAPLVLSAGAFVLFWPAIIRDYTLCTSLELFTDRDVVEKIDAKSRKRKLQRKAQILNYLRMSSGYRKAARSDDDFNELKLMGQNYLTELPEHIINFYVSAFHAFARDPITITLEEVDRALNALKIADIHTGKMSENWYHRLTQDKSHMGFGLQDFLLLIGMLLYQKETTHGGAAARIDHDLFDTVDVDGDGFLTLDDIQVALKGLKPEADRSEIQQLLTDIAEGSGRQVTRDMFDSWVTQVDALTRKHDYVFRASTSKLSNVSSAPESRQEEQRESVH